MRMLSGSSPVEKPGPKKVEPLDLAALKKAMEVLRHGRKRSAGAGQLYVFHRNRISRRDLEEMVREAREKAKQEAADEMKHIAWLIPGMVWSLDDTLVIREPRSYLHQVKDVAARYVLPPRTGAMLHGEEVALNLRRLVWRFGAPLFMKRDNGGNLNHEKVNEVLEDHWIIPLNSPPHYPQYNGGVERSQRDIKEMLVDVEPAALQPWAEIRAHDLNHRRRRILGVKTPCEAFFGGKSALRQYDRRRRKGVYDEIMETALRIDEHLDDAIDPTRTAAWRVSVENWLRRNGAIAVSSGGRVSPYFQRIWSHN